MSPSPVLSHKRSSRSTISQHMLTKCFKNIIWVIMMSNAEYYPLIMSRTAYMVIESSMISKSRVFKRIFSYCHFGQKRLFFADDFFFSSKIDFGFQNPWNIILMFQKCFFNLFESFCTFSEHFWTKIGDPSLMSRCPP